MNLDAALELLSRTPDAPLDVAEVALWLAKDEFPDLDVDAHLAELSAMAHEASRYLRGDLAARVAGLCRYLFHDMGFHGNIKDYYDPFNSYFNQVLERRTGIPITLSALVMAVGRRAGITMAGVGLPGHFIVKAAQGAAQILIDPFHGGRVLSGEDCVNLVLQTTGVSLPISGLSLEPVPLGLIVQRMLGNLKAIYVNKGDYVRGLRVMERLHRLNPQDIGLRRDLGMTLVKLEQFGKAVDHLRVYLEHAAEADDFETVSKILQNVRQRLAEWN